MSAKRFNISINDEEREGLDLSTLLEMMTQRKLAPTDLVFNEELGSWQMLMENSEIMKALKETVQTTKTKPTVAKTDTLNLKDHGTGTVTKSVTAKQDVKASNFSELPSNPMLTEWYILKGENKFGPFQYIEVIKMLQEKVVFEFDYTWQKGMESWVRIAEIKDFCPEHIKKLQDSLMPEIKNVFFRRKHLRIPFISNIIIHDNNNVWKGQAVELSEGGAGLIMENALIVPGQKIYMHFKPNGEMPAFNAIGEVVSKKFIEGVKEKKTPICYGVKFTNLSENTLEHLKKYTKLMDVKPAA
ncbi:MAG: DUF4339 domain-containing protein [Bdellovibrionaceae bacterium]|nr:DUF4339 domain-containing protein [Pseudobdellovibrionaceae bacterium]